MKKIISVILALAVAFSVFTFSFNASAQSYAIALPETTSLFIKDSVAKGDITLTEEQLFKLQLCDALYKGLKEFKGEIDVSHLSPEKYSNFSASVSQCMALLINEYPDMFWLSDVYYGYSSSESCIYIYYPESAKELYTPMLVEYNYLLNEIVEKVPESTSDVGKALFVYDYLALNYEYDTSYTIYDAYTFLKEKTGVCDAYSKTFKAVMDRLGIPTTRAVNTAGNHAWNIVRINGKNYHIDATHADPIPDSYGNVSHDYFLRSTAALESIDPDGKRSLYKTSENCYLDFANSLCTDTLFENGYLWSASASAFVFYNGYFFFVEDNSSYVYWTDSNGNYITDENGIPYIKDFNCVAVIYKTKDFKTKTEVLRQSSANWSLTDGRFYPYYYAGISIIDSQIYYNTADSVMCYDLQTETGSTLFTVTDSYICTLLYGGNSTFCYMAMDKSSGTRSKATFTLKDKGQLVNNGASSYADDIVALRKYILSGNSSGLCLAKADISGSDQSINVIDLIHLKKLAA